MEKYIVLGLIQIPTIIFLFIVGYLMPALTRKEIVFGVRVPETYLQRPELAHFRQDYRRRYTLTTGIFSAVLCVVLLFVNHNVVFSIGIFAIIGLAFWNYYVVHKKVREVKRRENWLAGKRQVTIIDTQSSPQDLVSAWWFLLPLGLVLINFAIGWFRYDSLPERIPMHWNLQGHVDRWAPKTVKNAFVLPIVEAFMTALMFFVFKIIGWSKRQLRVADPEGSRLQNVLFRRRLSGFIIFGSVALVLLMSFGYLQILQVIHVGAKLQIFSIALFLIAILGGVLIISLRTGQGGSRIAVPASPGNVDVVERDDDRYWKLGAFYYNPQDPAFFVEKRFGVGWTINFGNRLAVLILVVFLIVLVLLPFLL